MEENNMYTCEEKYQNDPQFKSIVDCMVSAIYQNKYSPSELREMAVFASIKYEMEHVRPVYKNFSKPLP